jgi:uncharacterized protein YyaL (SSP411 family)
MVSSETAKPNALAREKSPYLLQHSMNPVNWYPWSEVAFKKAKNDGKPILLSIGYSTCHWCHRLREESFEDGETANMINKNFIAIKVDREERPEVDAYYMNAVQSMTGSGGWPLTVFLTPDLQPYYGGTYFPPEPRYGMPSFKQVLEFAARVWKERKDEALSTAQQVAASLRQVEESSTPGEISVQLFDNTFSALISSFDEKNGGFGSAPKFPLPLSISFMLRYHFRTGNQLALRTVTKTLDAIALGGIRDHLGGGFHRYATDRVWLVPHFEKMLYDNALLAMVYVDAFLVTGDQTYSTAVKETLGWLNREMQCSEGGFYTAQDADTSAGEGAFYTWTRDEVESVLGAVDGGQFCSLYGVTQVGNFEGGRSILHLRDKKISGPTIREWSDKLLAERSKRPRPTTDTKVLTSWNGLAISAFARAGSALESKQLIESARRATDFIISKCANGDTLLRRYAGGEAGIEGTLEDYSYFSQGLLDLFQTDGDPKWLSEAMRFTDTMIRDFVDERQAGFFMTKTENPIRMKETYDGPTPSGNSVAAINLLRLSELTGVERYRKLGEGTLRTFRRQLDDQPAGHAYMMAGVDLVVNGIREIVITAQNERTSNGMFKAVSSTYLPDSVIVPADRENYDALTKITKLLEGRNIGSQSIAYVCRDSSCKLPARSVEELMGQLRSSQ